METFESQPVEWSSLSEAASCSRLFTDFYCHQHELIVEVDGGIHELQKEYDVEREAYFRAIGFRIFRVTNDEVNKN